MRRLLPALVLLTASLVPGCSDSIVSPVEPVTGQLTLYIPSHPAEVVAVEAVIWRDGLESVSVKIPFGDPDQSAVGTISNIPVGDYALAVIGKDGHDDTSFYGAAPIFVDDSSATSYDLIFNPATEEIEIYITGTYTGCVEPAGEIVSWWPAENTTVDVTGRNHATVGPGVTYIYGKVEKTFHFNGIDGRLRVPDNQNLRFTGSFTIEGWIFPWSHPVGYAAGQILLRGDDRIGTDPYYLALLPDGRLRFHVASLSAETNLESELPLTVGHWHHVAAVLDSTSGAMTLVVDGSTAGRMTTSVRPFRNLDPAYDPIIGIGNTGSIDPYHNQPFHGYIDELSIYRTALDSTAIRSIVLAGKFGKCREGGGILDSITVSRFASGFTQPAGLIFDVYGRLLVANFQDPGIISGVTMAGAVDTFAWAPSTVAALARDSSGYISSYRRRAP